MAEEPLLSASAATPSFFSLFWFIDDGVNEKDEAEEAGLTLPVAAVSDVTFASTLEPGALKFNKLVSVAFAGESPVAAFVKVLEASSGPSSFVLLMVLELFVNAKSPFLASFFEPAKLKSELELIAGVPLIPVS